MTTEKKTSNKTPRQTALLRLIAELTASLDEKDICQRVVEGLHDTLDYDFLAVFLYDKHSRNRILVSSIGFGKMPTHLLPGQGLSERPILDGQLHYTPDVNTLSEYVYGMGGSEVDVPILIGDNILGVLVAESKDTCDFSTDDFEVLTAAAQQAGLAIEKARLLASERQRADELDALRKTMAEVNAELELSSLLQAIVERSADLLASSGGELGLYNEPNQEIEIVVSYNLGEDYVGLRHRLGEGAMGKVALTKEPLIIKDYQTWEGRLTQYTRIRAVIAAPLLIGGRLVGVFTSVSMDPARRFDDADLNLLSMFGQQAAIAIENARLFNQAQLEINERKRFEEEILRQKEYFEALFVNSPVAVTTADLDGVIVSWNPTAEKLFGYSSQEVVGVNLDDIVANDASIRDEAERNTRDVIKKGRVQSITKRTRKDGSMVDVELLALPVIVGGEKVGFISIYVDITTLQEARRQAETANQAKNIFLAKMSHELRTPLNAILGFSQLMAPNPNLTDEQKEYLSIITQSGEHLLNLINDVLDTAKIEAGKIVLRETSFNLYDLLSTLENIFRLQSEDKGLLFRFARSSDVPQYVIGDENRLRQVLMNLLGNAVKFTTAGEVSLSVELLTSDEPTSAKKVSLGFTIEDTGPGIAMDDLQIVFEPFAQAASTPEIHKGTGLGLAISRQFVNLMGGDISVSSHIGQGSVFKFDVQLGLSDFTHSQPHRKRRLGLEPSQPVFRLLVVEDQENNRRLLTNLLVSMGFDVKQAANGQEAVNIWEDWQPHLIWMDMRMPVLDGYEATRRIKNRQKSMADQPANLQTVIIALTASAFDEDRAGIINAGCDDIVNKPFRQDDIFDTLSNHLGVRYIYQEEPDIKMRIISDYLIPKRKIATALESLPDDWKVSLQGAIQKANYSQILSLIDQVEENHPELVEVLIQMTQNYEYDKLLALIENSRSGK